MATDPIKNPRDDEFMKRLQEEQSEAEDAEEFSKPRPADLHQEEGDTRPENT
jgi:hypothetical protein